MTGKQRHHLRGLAHHLDPVVMIGRRGVSDSVVRQIEGALDDHELIKVKVLEDCPVDRGEVAALCTLQTECEVVGQIGRILVLYRARKEGPTIRLPD
jgi:RNA-binding protein